MGITLPNVAGRLHAMLDGESINYNNRFKRDMAVVMQRDAWAVHYIDAFFGTGKTLDEPDWQWWDSAGVCGQAVAVPAMMLVELAGDVGACCGKGLALPVRAVQTLMTLSDQMSTEERGRLLASYLVGSTSEIFLQLPMVVGALPKALVRGVQAIEVGVQWGCGYRPPQLPSCAT